MARQRMLHPSFFTDGEMLALSPYHRLLFQGLWCYADREGRLEDKPIDLKVRILPIDPCDVNELLAGLERAGRVVRYTVDGRRYLEIGNFARYQNPHPKEPPSKIPAAPAGLRFAAELHGEPGNYTANHGEPGNYTASRVKIHPSRAESLTESLTDPEDPFPTETGAEQPAPSATRDVATGPETGAPPEKPKRQPRPKKPPDPRIIPLREVWERLYREATGRQYTPAYPRDHGSIAAMLAVKLGDPPEPITPAEVERRFKNALAQPFYRGPAGHLATVWSHFSGLAATPGTGPPTRGPLAPPGPEAYEGGPRGF